MATDKPAPRPVKRATPLKSAQPLKPAGPKRPTAPQASAETFPDFSNAKTSGGETPAFAISDTPSATSRGRSTGRPASRATSKSSSRTSKGRSKKKQPPVAALVGIGGVALLLVIITVVAVSKSGSSTGGGNAAGNGAANDPNAWYNQPTANVGGKNSSGAKARKSTHTAEELRERHASFTVDTGE